jgi:hypothetical protein
VPPLQAASSDLSLPAVWQAQVVRSEEVVSAFPLQGVILEKADCRYAIAEERESIQERAS